MIPQSGRQIVDKLVDASYALGWRSYHSRPAQTSRGYRTALQGHAGFPDVVLARHGELLVVEVKGSGDQLRAEQLDWLVQLGGPAGGSLVAAGVVTGVEADDVIDYMASRHPDRERLRAALSARWQALGLPERIIE